MLRLSRACRGPVDCQWLLWPAALLRHSTARVREAGAVRLEMATAAVPVRLASTLGRLLQAASAAGAEYVVRLTQAELSQMIGAFRNAVGASLRP